MDIMDMEEDMENEQINIVNNKAALDIAMILDDMWRGLKKFYWIFLFLISMAATVFFVKAKIQYVPTYQAYASYVVNTQNAYGYSETYYNKTTAAQLGKTFPYILTSGVLKQVVAEELEMDSVPAEISAEAMEDTALFTIYVKAKDPQLAYDVLQSVIKNYPTVAQYIIGDTQLILMDESGVPESPINVPNLKNSAMKGAALGCMICVGFLFLYAMTRNTVRKEDDLKMLLSVQLLGNVPKVTFKKRSNKKNQLVLIDHKDSSIVLGETFRTIRTRLTKEADDNNIKQIMFTSAVESEGKSTIAANYAISLAKKRKRVVLVDCDMRNPSVLSVLGLEKPKKGICDVLKGDCSVQDALINYRNLSLKVLPGIEVVNNPTKFLSGKYMKGFLEELSKDADYVIVDAPPCLVVSDANVLARHVEGCVFVVRQDYCRIERIVSGVDSIAETGIQMLGYVINGTEAGITKHGYNYEYGYGYGYGYRKNGDKQESGK